jgi:D-glycero-D-manno-heptose 1,7-bisphosphate phosphatase
MKRAIFLDRDGTICEDRHYLRRVEDLRILPGVVDALKRLQKKGFQLIIVTNQSGVARGLFSEETLSEIHAALIARLASDGIRLRAIYHCPHLDDEPGIPDAGTCDCRKPKPGLILAAASEHDLDLARSFMIGDKASDIEAGRQAGCRSILLHPPCAEAVAGPDPDWVAPDLSSAADWILQTEEA